MMIEADLHDYYINVGSFNTIIITCRYCTHREIFYPSGGSRPISDITKWILDHVQEDATHKKLAKPRRRH